MVVWACDGADLFKPKPNQSVSALVAPICGTKPSTIWPSNPGPGTVVNNGLGGKNITGTSGPDVITGSNFSDSIFGLDGDDVICGKDGDDVVIGGAGADRMQGNLGIDVADYYGSPVGVQASLRMLGKKGHAAGDALSTIERIHGSPNADILKGDNGANVLKGMGGGDRLDGEGGPDELDGGPGTDQVFFTIAPGMVVADLTSGGRMGSAAGDSYISVENLLGSVHGDTLIGTGDANVIDGAEGSDIIYGLAGADNLIGGIGNDKLYGDVGRDRLNGNTGTNTLDGGGSVDSGTANCGDSVVSVENLISEACPASPETSTMALDSVAIRADSVGFAVITVQLKDEAGNNLTQGGFTVTLTTTAGVLTNGTTSSTSMNATDMLDGTYQLKLVGGHNPAVATITGTLNGVPMAYVENIPIIGRTITWTGAIDTNWNNKSNWSPVDAPCYADSVVIPAGTPSAPVLVQNEVINGVTILDNAVINNGAFSLTSTGNILSAPSVGGFTGAGAAVAAGPLGSLLSGTFYYLRITGSYALADNAVVDGGRLTVLGKIRNTSYRLRVIP